MASINYSAAELEALLESVPPRITHTRASSPGTVISTLANLQTWLDTIASGMGNFGVRFVSFTASSAFAPFRAATYEGMVMKGSSSGALNVVFFNITGSSSSTYPTVLYMRQISGTWDNPQTIAQ